MEIVVILQMEITTQLSKNLDELSLRVSGVAHSPYHQVTKIKKGVTSSLPKVELGSQQLCFYDNLDNFFFKSIKFCERPTYTVLAGCCRFVRENYLC